MRKYLEIVIIMLAVSLNLSLIFTIFSPLKSNITQMFYGISIISFLWIVMFYLREYKKGAKMPLMNEKIPYTFTSVTFIILACIFVAILLFMGVVLYIFKNM